MLYEKQDKLLKLIIKQCKQYNSDTFEYITEYLGYLPFGQYQWLEIDDDIICNNFKIDWKFRDIKELESKNYIIKIDEESVGDDQKIYYKLNYEKINPTPFQ